MQINNVKDLAYDFVIKYLLKMEMFQQLYSQRTNIGFYLFIVTKGKNTVPNFK